jgi:hypothetical protein
VEPLVELVDCLPVLHVEKPVGGALEKFLVELQCLLQQLAADLLRVGHISQLLGRAREHELHGLTGIAVTFFCPPCFFLRCLALDRFSLVCASRDKGA